MAVRNFWIDADIDGRATELSGGPRSKDGGMSVIIKQRSNGGITTAFRISCGVYKNQDGELMLETTIYDADGHVVAEHSTER